MKNSLDDYDLSCRHQRYRARKAGFDVPKMKAGAKPTDIWGQIEKTDGCWIWKGRKNAWGYGNVSINGKSKQAHRLVWERVNGREIGESVAMHICDNPACCNPDHIVLGTHADNQKDKVRKGRQAVGEKIAASILTEKQVRSIRSEYIPRVVTYKHLAKKYGVCEDTIRKAIARIYWKHI